ncbi:MAG: cupin domain-containing protein [Ferruginibacter sp.]
MNNKLTPKEIIEKFKLLPHPEGGYFRENYRSLEIIPKTFLPKRFNGERSYSTAIYFLLEQGNFSAFHRIQSDECWHFYSGGRLNIYVIQLNGKLDIIKLGSDISQGELFQAVVPAGCWFASEPAPETEYTLAGCTVAPGFDFNDFEMAAFDNLSKQFPQHRAIIQRLCR